MFYHNIPEVVFVRLRPQHMVSNKRLRNDENSAKQSCYTKKSHEPGSKHMATALQSDSLTAREFAETLIVGLAAVGQHQIVASQTQLHRAFRRVLAEVRNTPLKVDLSDVDYDPLYGLSGWLDEFLARAQRDLLISSPNPSYERVQIKVTKEEAEARLADNNNAQVFKNLSNLFVSELRS